MKESLIKDFYDMDSCQQAIFHDECDAYDQHAYARVVVGGRVRQREAGDPGGADVSLYVQQFA